MKKNSAEIKKKTKKKSKKVRPPKMTFGAFLLYFILHLAAYAYLNDQFITAQDLKDSFDRLRSNKKEGTGVLDGSSNEAE